jgi:hypothetical protein
MTHLIISIGILATLVLAAPPASSEEIPRFAIYRVDLVDNELAPPLDQRADNPHLLNLFVTQEYVLATSVKQNPPVITELDIVDFCWTSQVIKLTPEGARRWDSMGGYHAPLDGLPLLIEIDGEPRYAAMLWNPASSQICKLPVIWCKALDNRLLIRGLFATKKGDTLHKEDYDPHVRQVMDDLGKWSVDCENH